MPRYYFHVRDTNRLIRDNDGIDLPGLGAAREEARLGALDMLNDAALTGDNILHQAIEVCDEAGTRLAEVKLSLVARSDDGTGSPGVG